jgi:hypothetical protein
MGFQNPANLNSLPATLSQTHSLQENDMAARGMNAKRKDKRRRHAEARKKIADELAAKAPAPAPRRPAAKH